MRTLYIEVVTELPDGEWDAEIEEERVTEIEDFLRSMKGIVSVEVKGVE